MNEIIQAISTVGFPIACCCFLLWQNSRQDEYHREQMENCARPSKAIPIPSQNLERSFKSWRL